MKKLLLITALIGTLGLAGYQVASATIANFTGRGWGWDSGYCGNFGHNGDSRWGGGRGHGMGSGTMMGNGSWGYRGRMTGW